MKPTHRTASAVLIATALFSVGCKDRDEITVYRVSKDAGQPAGGGGMAGADSSGFESEATPGLATEAPAGWEAQPTSAMRLASFLVKGDKGATADVSLIVLGGAAGGVLENVNRWLGQLGQESITEEKLNAMAQHVTTPVGDVMIVDLAGLPQGADAAKDGRILAGLASAEGRTLFFKMRGNADLVGAQKDAFIKWVSSVRLTEGGEAQAAASAPATTAPEPAQTEAAAPRATWQAPESWKQEQASSMRYATYSVSGQGGEKGDVSISFFPGDTGGDLANVNRWRGQAGLEPIAESDLQSSVTKVANPGGDFQLVDLPGKTTRVLAAWRMAGGNTWFFKLSGPDALVGAEKDNFVKFIQSVQFKP